MADPSSIPVGPGHVALIVGPSGSGKSRTLDLLLQQLAPSVETCPPPHPDGTAPVINMFSSETAALRLLSVVGLADALIWARPFPTLSVGQQARCLVALMLDGPGDVMVIDEWLANLDRPTARAVAWAAQRALRRTGRGAILVTAHDDLVEDVQPDTLVRVNWSAEPDVVQARERGGPCSVLEELTLGRGTTADWARLKPLHYAAGDPATVHSVWTATHPGIHGPAAVVVASYPDLHSSARNLATDRSYQNVHDRRVATRLNREVVKLSRIVVCPQLRGVGLAGLMLEHVVSNIGAKWVECVTSMGRWSGFLRRVGFQEIPQTCHPSEAALMDWANRSRPPAPAYLDGVHLLDFIDGLSVRGRREGRRLVWSFFHHFVLHRRTRSPAPKQVPGPADDRWPEAADLAARRLHERPSYWVLGPIDTMTGLPTGDIVEGSVGAVQPA